MKLLNPKLYTISLSEAPLALFVYVPLLPFDEIPCLQRSVNNETRKNILIHSYI